MEEYEAAHTNYFGNQHEDENSLETALHQHFSESII